MNILHSTTNPPLLQRLKEMLGSSARADIAVGYFFDRLRASFFISGFEQVSWAPGGGGVVEKACMV